MKKTDDDDDDFVTVAGGRRLKVQASDQLAKSFRTFKQLMFVIFVVMIPITLIGVGQVVSCRYGGKNLSWEKCIGKLTKSAFESKDNGQKKK